MEAVSAILPVLFMLVMGFFARRCKILTPEHNAGIKKLIFSILLPILVFNATFTMSIDSRHMKIMLFMFGLQCLTLGAGYVVFRLMKTDYSHISPYIMTTIEGGNAFYPLYIGLVGTAYTGYFVLLDIPGIFMIFLVIPLILARTASGGSNAKEMLRSIYTNPIVCVLFAGILLNLTGISGAFMKTPLFPAYESLMSMATAPLAPLILFTLGYSFSIGRESLPPIIKTILARIVLMACGIAAAFLLFPWIRNDQPLKIAVILFLMSPPAFAMPIILEKLYKRDTDGEFCSTCISMHMLFTIIAFTVIAITMY